ncbi:MAG: hypothetical protein B7X03_03130 [Parcubacteria group bacterium 21-58-10]|nr:MAG: hypothetical protein B7X03_03130 [Parcubacteria group bacterium 21-58-10]
MVSMNVVESTPHATNCREHRILFLFSGAANRKRIVGEIARGENADTALRGANHIAGAEFIDVEATVRGMVPTWFYHLLPWQARSIVLYPRMFAYDVIIAQDDLLLGYLVSLTARFLHKKTRWFCIVVNSSVLIRRHTAHLMRLFMLKTFWKSYTRIICLSREQLEDLARIGISRERLVFVPFGIDADFYAPVDNSHEEDFILSVGRDLGRDYPTLLEAAKRSNHPFVIVAARKNLSADTPLPPNVSMRYDLPLTEVRDLYARAKMVVVVSKEEDAPEGSDCSGQTVILDAMAAGKVVIATERSWMRDYFTPDKELVIVAPHDPATLAAAIERLWSDVQERVRMAAAGRAKVQGHYTTKTFAAALQDIVIPSPQ